MFDGIKNAFNRVWGRKTFIILVVLVAGTLVDIFSKNGLSTNLMSLLGVLAGAFTVGNGIENSAASKTAIAQVSATPTQDPKLAEQVSLANQSLATVMETLSYIIKTSGMDNPDEYMKKVAALKPVAANRAAASKVLAGE